MGGPEMANNGWLQLMKQLDLERIMISAQFTGDGVQTLNAPSPGWSPRGRR